MGRIGVVIVRQDSATGNSAATAWLHGLIATQTTVVDVAMLALRVKAAVAVNAWMCMMITITAVLATVRARKIRTALGRVVIAGRVTQLAGQDQAMPPCVLRTALAVARLTAA
jgi:hypothetical protein